ncbi:MAG: hypothetical protein EXR71_16035 [Myxococcales bacterium]|nr:hypothetical protein [Myxococcales bacterium]
MLLLLALACVVKPYGPPVGVPVVSPPPSVEAAGVVVEPLLSRLDRLLAVTDEVDRRDRLVELRDLLVGLAGVDGKAQARVRRYAERILAVEERVQPFDMAESPMELASGVEPVIEVEVAEPPPAAGP